MPGGTRLVEELSVGDEVMTLDHGPQKVRWIGCRAVDAQGVYAPVRITRGALGNTRDLLVSLQHRMLITGWRAQM